MRSFLLIGILAFALGRPAMADLKIAVVDTGKAFDSYYKTKETATRIAAKEAGYKREIQDLQAEYQQSSQEAQSLEDAAKNPSNSPDVRKEKDTELASKVQSLQAMEKELGEMTRQRSQEIRDELQRSHEEISEGIVKVIIDYAKPLGYDETSKEISHLPYNSAKIVDITPVIIEKLNASAPPAATHG